MSGERNFLSLGDKTLRGNHVGFRSVLSIVDETGWERNHERE